MPKKKKSLEVEEVKDPEEEKEGEDAPVGKILEDELDPVIDDADLDDEDDEDAWSLDDDMGE